MLQGLLRRLLLGIAVAGVLSKEGFFGLGVLSFRAWGFKV